MLKDVCVFFILANIGAFSFSYANPADSKSTDKSSWTLSQVLAYAQKHSPRWTELQIQNRGSEIQVSLAESQFKPTLKLESTHGLDDHHPMQNPRPWTSNWTLGVEQALINNGYDSIQLSIAKNERESLHLSTTAQRDELTLEIAQSFVRLSLQNRILEIQKKYYELLQQQFKRISSDYQSGQRTWFDYSRFQSQVTRAELAVVQAESDIHQSEADLLHSIGHDRSSAPPWTELELLSLKSCPTVPTFEFNLDDHPLLKSLAYDQKAAELRLEKEQKLNGVQWFAQAGLKLGDGNYFNEARSPVGSINTEWFALLTARYQIWDGGKNASSVAWVENNLKKTINEIKIKRQSFDNQFKKFKIEKENSNLICKTAQQLLNSEVKNSQFLEREYRNGKIQFLDFTTGLSNLSSAQVEITRAIATSLQMQFKQLYFKGQIEDDIFKK